MNCYVELHDCFNFIIYDSLLTRAYHILLQTKITSLSDYLTNFPCFITEYENQHTFKNCI